MSIWLLSLLASFVLILAMVKKRALSRVLLTSAS